MEKTQENTQSGFPVREAPLRDGSTLAIEVAEPPFSRSCDWERLCWWPLIREKVMRGNLNRWMLAPHFVGRIDGQVAGTMCYYAPRDTREVGTLQFVSTEERFRRRGVASALVGALIRHFTAQGGRVLYLCTTNPVAGHLYESHGFRYHVGDGMRYLAPDADDFDRRWFAAGRAAIRDAHWGDLARLCVLYNHPDPPWLIKDSLSASLRDTRYESHFVRVFRATEDGNGAFLVLEAPDARVVGAVAFRRFDTFCDQHVAELSFRIGRPHFDRAAELLNAAAERASALGIEQLALTVAAQDGEQRRLAESAGFVEGARWPRRLRSGGGCTDLLIMLRELTPTAPGKPRESFYGERQPWQAERVAGRGAASAVSVRGDELPVEGDAQPGAGRHRHRAVGVDEDALPGGPPAQR